MPSLSMAMVITLAVLPFVAAAFVGAAVLVAETMPRKARMVAYAVAVVAAVVVTVVAALFLYDAAWVDYRRQP